MVDKQEVFKLLKEGKSQTDIAAMFNVSRQAIHILKREFIEAGKIADDEVVKYPKREPRAFDNPLLHSEYAELLKKYKEMYESGSAVRDIILVAQEDGIHSAHRAITEFIETIKRERGTHAQDAYTGLILAQVFHNKKFMWDGELKVVDITDTRPNTKDVENVFEAKELYDQFSNHALIKYITWSKWIAHTGKTFKVENDRRVPWRIKAKDLVDFLNVKFTGDLQEITKQKVVKDLKEKSAGNP